MKLVDPSGSFTQFVMFARRRGELAGDTEG